MSAYRNVVDRLGELEREHTEAAEKAYHELVGEFVHLLNATNPEEISNIARRMAGVAHMRRLHLHTAIAASMRTMRPVVFRLAEGGTLERIELDQGEATQEK